MLHPHIHYKIVTANSPEELEKQVHELLDQGWKLKGGMVPSTQASSGVWGGAGTRFHQTLIKD